MRLEPRYQDVNFPSSFVLEFHGREEEYFEWFGQVLTIKGVIAHLMVKTQYRASTYERNDLLDYWPWIDFVARFTSRWGGAAAIPTNIQSATHKVQSHLDDALRFIKGISNRLLDQDVY